MPNALIADILQQGLHLRIKVTGRSMRPFINNGEVVTLRQIPPESLQCGDIIFFTGNCGAPVMHRIVAKTVQPDNNPVFTTKGDGLLQEDMPVRADRILGKAFLVEKKLPGLGTVQVPLDSVLSLSLSKIYTLLFKTKHQMKIILKKLVFPLPTEP